MSRIVLIFSFLFICISSYANDACKSEDEVAESLGLAYDLADKHDCSLSMDQTSCAGLAASLGFASVAAGSKKFGNLFHKSLLTRTIKKEVKAAEKNLSDRIANGFKRENSIREYRLRQNAYKQARARWYKENLDSLIHPRKRAALKKELMAKAQKEVSTYVKANVPLEFATEQLKALEEYETKGLTKERGLVRQDIKKF